MFQSGIRRSKTPSKYFYNTRSLPKSCNKQIQFPQKYNSISVCSDKDSNAADTIPQRCYSSVKINQTAKRQSFSSIYSTKTRYDNIMGLKPKKIQPKTRTMSLSLELESFSQQDKQNSNKQQTRLDKIMSISVVKPQVVSTLKNYDPPRKQKIHPIKKIKRQDSDTEWRQCKRKIARMGKQEQKQNMLWKSFERERQKRYLEAKKKEQLEKKKERERQVRFERMVEKELRRIEEENEVKKRQNKAFSPYLYPLY